MLLFPLSAVGLAHSSTSLGGGFLRALEWQGPTECHSLCLLPLPAGSSLAQQSLSTWLEQPIFDSVKHKRKWSQEFYAHIWKNSVCCSTLNGCERGKIEITRTFTQGRARNVMVTKRNNKLRCQWSTRTESGFFFDGTPVSNCKLLVKWAERRKDDEAINRKGRWVQGCCFD